MRLKTVLREPLLHFLAIGAALFACYHWTGGGSGAASDRIVVAPGQVNRLGVGFLEAWQRPPSDAELKALIDDWVREEIAVREAMAVGLDRDDAIIRRRLRQKLEFLLEDVAAEVPPTDAELQAWLIGHADAFRVVPGSLPTLAEVRPAVEREFLADRRKRQLAAMYQRLLGKYTVVVEKSEKGGS